MLLNRAVSSFFPLLIIFTSADPHCVDHLLTGATSDDDDGQVGSRHANNSPINTGPRDKSFLYVNAQDKTQDNHSNNDNSRSDRTGLLWLKHIRHRRKHHNEFAQQPTVIPQEDGPSLAPSNSSRWPSFRRGLVREKRLLLNTTSSLLYHPRGANFNNMTSPASIVDGQVSTTTMITSTEKVVSNYNLSNSTDPYAFSTETHSFALPSEVQVS